eukprot:Awhi_evm1s5952
MSESASGPCGKPDTLEFIPNAVPEVDNVHTWDPTKVGLPMGFQLTDYSTLKGSRGAAEPVRFHSLNSPVCWNLLVAKIFAWTAVSWTRPFQ